MTAWMATGPVQASPKPRPLRLGSGGNICVVTVRPPPPASTHGLEGQASGAFANQFADRFSGHVLSDLNGLGTEPSALLAVPQCDPRKGNIVIRVTLRVDKAGDRYVIGVSARAGRAVYTDHLERARGSQWQKHKVHYVDDPGPHFDHWRYTTQNAISIDARAMAARLERRIAVRR